MTLAELAVSYQEQAGVLGERIAQVRLLPEGTGQERMMKRDRLRILGAMHRDMRELAVLCERYYDKSYRRNERYCV